MTDIIFGIVVPAVVFIFSFTMTYLLYKHFSKKTSITPETADPQVQQENQEN